MSTPDPINLDNEDAVLDYTHGKRKQIVDKLTENGKIPVDDPKQMGALLATLDGMDRAAMGKKRIKSDEKVGNQQAAAAGIIAEILRKSTGTHLRSDVIDVIARPAPRLGAEVPNPVLVVGETTTSASQQSFETFASANSPVIEDSAER